MNEIIRLHVPGDLKYTRLVEEFTLSISDYIYPGNKQAASTLRSVMNEVFINIVEHSETPAKNELVRIQFEIGSKSFLISIYDHGPGIPIEGSYMPYPKNFIGKRYELRKVLDGTVFYTVVDPYTLSFTFEESREVDLDRLGELDRINGNGMGISIVTKIMDSVTYTYLSDGLYDWRMVKKLG